MAVRVQKKGVVPAMVVPFEFQKFGTSGVSAGQAQGQHGRFAAGISKPNRFSR